MKQLIITPDGWKTTLAECPPGFFLVEKELCFKSEYRTDKGSLEVFCSSGEAFWSGADSMEVRDQMEVQPVIAEWIDG